MCIRDSANIDVRATVQLNALGEAVAKASGSTNAVNGTVIGSNVIFRGAMLSITDYEFDSGRVAGTLKKGGAIVKKTENNHRVSSTGNTTVDTGTVLYLSDAAAGIYIDVSYYNGALLIREVGVKEPYNYYTNNGSGNIVFNDISNNLQGRAYIYADNQIELTVYDQAMLPRVIITNSTDRGITDVYKRQAIALGGQVLLVFNRSDAYAGINRKNIAQAGAIVMDLSLIQI